MSDPSAATSASPAAGASYAIQSTGTTTMVDGTSTIPAAITGGTINGTTGAVTVTIGGKYTINLPLTDATVSPTSLTATIKEPNGTSAVKLTGSNSVYTGSLTAPGGAGTITGLTLKAVG